MGENSIYIEVTCQNITSKLSLRSNCKFESTCKLPVFTQVVKLSYYFTNQVEFKSVSGNCEATCSLL